MNRYPLFAYITLISPLIPICIGLIKILSVNRGMKILLYYLIFAISIDIFLAWIVKGRQLQMGFVHGYYLVEYVFIISIIMVWQESHRMKRFFQALMLLYILFWIIAKFTFEPLSGLYSITATTSQVLLTLSAGYTLFIVIGNRVQPLTKDYRFWVLLSCVVYYTGTLLTIALRGILIQYSLDKFFLFTSLDWSLKIIFNMLFTIGFLCPQTQQ